MIGASRDRTTVGGALFHNLLKHDFQGAVYPVNPRSRVIQSIKAYPDIEAVPETVALALIVVPGAHVNETLEACGKKGVCAAVVISAGFKEIGGEGVERERQMVAIARRYDTRFATWDPLLRPRPESPIPAFSPRCANRARRRPALVTLRGYRDCESHPPAPGSRGAGRAPGMLQLRFQIVRTILARAWR